MNFGKYWKAVLAFLTLVASNALADLSQSGQPWPATGGEWARWAATVLGGTLIVYGKGNTGYVYEPKAVEPAEPVEDPVLPAPNGPTRNPRRRPVI